MKTLNPRMKLENENLVQAYLLLESGERFEGFSFGANVNNSGELGN